MQYKDTYTQKKEGTKGTTLTRNGEHVTRVKRHVSVAVGARTAALRVPVLPQCDRQQVLRQGRLHVVQYLVLLHLTVEWKPVGEILPSLVTAGGQPNTIKDTPWKKSLN